MKHVRWRMANAIWYHLYVEYKNNTNELIYTGETDLTDIENKITVTTGKSMGRKDKYTTTIYRIDKQQGFIVCNRKLHSVSCNPKWKAIWKKIYVWGLTWWLNAGDTGDVGSIPGSGRSPGEGNDNSLQYSCLGNLMDRGAGGLQFVGLQRVGHNSNKAWIYVFIKLNHCTVHTIL